MCAVVLVPAANATTMEGTPHVASVSGNGSLSASGRWGAAEWPYTAKLLTSFTPSQIEPNQGFTFSARNVEEVNVFFGHPSDCVSGGETQSDDNFTEWYFTKVASGGDMFNADIGSATILGVKTEHIINVTDCPFGVSTRDVMHVAPGSATSDLAPGCYQAATTNAGYDYPFPISFYSQTVVTSLVGTVATLKVGSGGPPCDTPQYRLGLTVQSPGQGEIRTADVACRISCGRDYTAGEVVAVTATPDAGWEFDHWLGACAGTGACSVTMAADRAVTAVFRPRRVRITVVKHSVNGGSGRVTAYGGLDCGPVCTIQVPWDPNASTLVAAQAQPGSVVESFAGDCGPGANALLPGDYGLCEVWQDAPSVVHVSFRGVLLSEVDAHAPSQDTMPQGNKYESAAAALGAAAEAGETCPGVIGGAVLPGPGWVLSAVLAAPCIGGLAIAVYEGVQVLDPPDPRYRTLALPHDLRLPGFGRARCPVACRDVVRALRPYRAAVAGFGGVEEARATATNRLAGAMAAGDREAMALQAGAIRAFAGRAVVLARRRALTGARLATALVHAHVRIRSSGAQMRAFANKLERKPLTTLPPVVLRRLRKAGLDNTAIARQAHEAATRIRSLRHGADLASTLRRERTTPGWTATYNALTIPQAEALVLALRRQGHVTAATTAQLMADLHGAFSAASLDARTRQVTAFQSHAGAAKNPARVVLVLAGRSLAR